MVNIPRALFSVRTSREPRYHVAIEELQDWTHMGNRLVLLKSYPGIVWERPNRTGARATWRTLSSLTDASGPRTHKLSLRFTNRSMNMRFDPSSLFEDARALSRKVRGRRGPMGNLAHARIMNSIKADWRANDPAFPYHKAVRQKATEPGDEMPTINL
jgi:hypothetical protein